MPWTAEKKRKVRAENSYQKEIIPLFFAALEKRDEIASKQRFRAETQSQVVLGRMFLGVKWKEDEEDELLEMELRVELALEVSRELV